jgi:hypothetical protein
MTWRSGEVPVSAEEYPRHQVVGMVGGEDGDWMAGVVAEALRAKAARREGAVLELEVLGSAATGEGRN